MYIYIDIDIYGARLKMGYPMEFQIDSTTLYSMLFGETHGFVCQIWYMKPNQKPPASSLLKIFRHDRVDVGMVPYWLHYMSIKYVPCDWPTQMKGNPVRTNGFVWGLDDMCAAARVYVLYIYFVCVYIYMWSSVPTPLPPRHGHGSAIILSPSPPLWCVWSVWYGMFGMYGMLGMYGRYGMYGMNGWYCMGGRYGM